MEQKKLVGILEDGKVEALQIGNAFANFLMPYSTGRQSGGAAHFPHTHKNLTIESHHEQGFDGRLLGVCLARASLSPPFVNHSPGPANLRIYASRATLVSRIKRGREQCSWVAAAALGMACLVWTAEVGCV